ncbi:MAG: hypothetical protein FH748_10540 [Balneolaceae bacterium]|nr:hypothetical protein [Balneolaceae bacterium]
MKTTLSFKLLMLVTILTLTSVSAHAQIAVGVKAGTAGYGGELMTSLTERINARVSGTFFSYNDSGVYADDDPSIAYNMKGEVTSIGGIIDFFPFKRGLKLSAGFFYHDFLVNGDATPDESYTIDDKTFSPEKLGSLTGKIEYESMLVPYAGIGIGNPLAKGSRLKLNFEIGALYTDAPSVTMEGEGMIAPTASQGQDFEDGMSDFKFYPVINLGLSFRLN